jgi:hypothetical protein
MSGGQNSRGQRKAMTTLTMRFQRGHFTVSGPDVEMQKFKTRQMPRIGA